MNSQRWFFLLYLFIAPLIVAFSQASILEFPTVDVVRGSDYDPLARIFYFPTLIGFFLLALGVLTTSILETIKRRDIPRKYASPVWMLSALVFLFLFWFGVNLSQRSVIIEYLGSLNPSRSPILGMFYLPTTPEIFPKMGFLPYYTTIVVGILAVLFTMAYCYTLFVDKHR